jgi:acyl carrier protein
MVHFQVESWGLRPRTVVGVAAKSYPRFRLTPRGTASYASPRVWIFCSFQRKTVAVNEKLLPDLARGKVRKERRYGTMALYAVRKWAQIRPRRDEIATFLKRLLVTEMPAGNSRLTEDSRIDSDFDIGSVVFVEIQVALEEQFDVELDPVHMVNLNVLRDVIDYIYDEVNRARDSET